jgi:adenosine deaminase
MTTAQDRPTAQARARALPKVLLHEHLDGGLRVATLLALLRERGMPRTSARRNGAGGLV